MKKDYFSLSCTLEETVRKKCSTKYFGSRQSRKSLLYTPARFHVFLNKKTPNCEEGMVTYFNISVIFSIFNRQLNILVLENYQASGRCLLGEVALPSQVSLCPMPPSSPRAKQLGLSPSVPVHCFLVQMNLEREKETTKMRERVRIIKSGLDLKISHPHWYNLKRLKDSIESTCYNHHLQIQKNATGKRKRKPDEIKNFFCNQPYLDENFKLTTKANQVKACNGLIMVISPLQGL